MKLGVIMPLVSSYPVYFLHAYEFFHSKCCFKRLTYNMLKLIALIRQRLTFALDVLGLGLDNYLTWYTTSIKAHHVLRAIPIGEAS